MPKHYQTIAPTRADAYRERERAERAAWAARREGAAPHRLRRLEAAAADAWHLHKAWVDADHIAALAGALD